MHGSVWRAVLAIVAGSICAASVSTPAGGELAGTPSSALNAATLRGGGKWQGGAVARSGPQRWDVDVTRADDGSIAGSVVLEGSALLQSGMLRGRVDGRRVAGSVTDPAGNHVATFVGTITVAGGLQGTYQDRSGEVGRWSWDGPLPR
jgi:hypothetical protein